MPQIEDEVLAAISEIDINASDLADKLAGDNGVLSTIGSSVDKLGESLKGATDQTEK
ncbi:MAG: hypothetical protein J6O41_06110 [Clostridia bacterium]|nr:hypothetical protein [Clostridia bacterium]